MAKKQTGRNIRKDITADGLAGRLKRSGIPSETVKQAFQIMEKKKG